MNNEVKGETKEKVYKSLRSKKSRVVMVSIYTQEYGNYNSR